MQLWTASLSATPALIIWGFLGVFDAFEVSTLYLSDGPKETVTFSAFLRSSVGDEGSEVVESRRDADGVR